tara:strand:- start:139 stop:465 length:327 start_codon:yes stop_codon:yes gene_type:complete
MFSSVSFAEKYICSYVFNNEARTSITERISNEYFLETMPDREAIYMRVLHEDEKYLVFGMLGTYTDFNGYYVSFIDKKTGTFRGQTIIEPEYEETLTAVISGNCFIQK